MANYHAMALAAGCDARTVRVSLNRGVVVVVADHDHGRAVIESAPEGWQSNALPLAIQRARGWAETLGVPCDE